jgi:hypothetical protein
MPLARQQYEHHRAKQKPLRTELNQAVLNLLSRGAPVVCGSRDYDRRGYGRQDCMAPEGNRL